MAQYRVRCTICEENFTTNLIGKVKDREWKLEHFSWICPECYENANQSEQTGNY